MRFPSRAAPHAAAACAIGLVVCAVWFLGFTPRWSGWWPRLGASDLERYFYPKFVVGNDALREGRLPLWNSNEFCGLPFLATAQVAALYPVKVLLFWLFPPPIAIRVLPGLHLALAGSLAYGGARAFGASWGGSLICGALVAVNIRFLDSLYHPMRLMVLAWTPLAWWAYDRALVRRTAPAVIGAGAVVALMTTAGYPLYVLCLAFCLLAPLTYHLATAPAAERPAVFGAALLVGVFAIGWSAIQMLPLLEMAGETNREALVADWEQRFPTRAVGWYDVWTLPQAVLGLLVMSGGALASLAAVGIGGTPRRIALPAFGALVLAQAATGLARPLLQHLPGFDHMRASELVWPMFAPFFVGPLAAIGWDRLTRGPRWGRWEQVVMFGGPVVVGLGTAYLFGWVATGVWAALAVAGGALLAHRRPGANAAVAVTIAAATGLMAVVYLQQQPQDLNTYPTAVDDAALRQRLVILRGGGRVFGPSLTWHGQMLLSHIPNVQGNEASLHPARIGRLLELAGIDGSQTLVEGNPNWDALRANRRLLDLLGVAVAVVPAPVPEYNQLDFDGPLPLWKNGLGYRNRKFAGRVFAVHHAVRATSPDEALARVIDPAFEFTTDAVVEDELPPLTEPTKKSNASIRQETPEAMEIEANMLGDGIVVVTDAWFPGWEATVDDRPTPVRRADYAFRGVAVPVGNHRVRLFYRPRSFRLGWVLALLTTAVAGVALRRRRPPALSRPEFAASAGESPSRYRGPAPDRAARSSEL